MVEMEFEMYGSILSKLVFQTFKGEFNPDTYLEWGSLCERIYQVNDLTKIKKICFAIDQFEGYAITWSDYIKRYHLALQGVLPPVWTDLKVLMRVKYVPKSYREELLAKIIQSEKRKQNCCGLL